MENSKNNEVLDIVKESVNDVLQELAGNAKTFVEGTVFSYVDDAIKDFQDTQTAEAATSASGWVKMRAKLINTGVGLVWSVTKKVVSKALEKAEKDDSKTVTA